MPIVSLDDIHISFGSNVVFDKLRMTFYPHEKVALVGPNGCGKTTLLKIILGAEQPDIGTVRTRKSLKIGYLPQEPHLSDDKTVIGPAPPPPRCRCAVPPPTTTPAL